MNKKIRDMIDEIFSDMKMSPENLALRDEMLANAQARFEDAVNSGRGEEEAFEEVASSLGDVQNLLKEMNSRKKESAPKEKNSNAVPDLGEALGKAVDALGEFGKQLGPQMEKLVRQANDATGNVFSEIGKATVKGVMDASKAAGEMFGKMQEDLFSFGKEKELTAEEMLKRAQELRVQAEVKQKADDQEGARLLRRKAYELETKAAAMKAEEEKAAAEAAAKAAGEAAEAAEEAEKAEAAEETAAEEPELEPEVEAVIREAEDVLEKEPAEAQTGEEEKEEPESSLQRSFGKDSIRKISVEVDADDVEIIEGCYENVSVDWEYDAKGGAEPALVADGSTLTIKKKNPDVFKTFFSAFQKKGGTLTIRVPLGSLERFTANTTSGDIRVEGVTGKMVSVSTVSGNVFVKTGLVREEMAANSVSGDLDVEVVTQKVTVTTVSGNMSVSAKANVISTRSVSGNMEVDGVYNSIHLDTVSGDIQLLCTEVPTERIKITTLSGNAHLAVPEDIRGFKAEASGIHASIQNEFGPNRYGTCALPISFESMSGELNISKLTTVFDIHAEPLEF